jgi:hypothetical protein
MVRKGSPVRVRQRASETALRRGSLIFGAARMTTSTGNGSGRRSCSTSGVSLQSPVRRLLSRCDARAGSPARRPPGNQWATSRRQQAPSGMANPSGRRHRSRRFGFLGGSSERAFTVRGVAVRGRRSDRRFRAEFASRLGVDHDGGAGSHVADADDRPSIPSGAAGCQAEDRRSRPRGDAGQCLSALPKNLAVSHVITRLTSSLSRPVLGTLSSVTTKPVVASNKGRMSTGCVKVR